MQYCISEALDILICYYLPPIIEPGLVPCISHATLNIHGPVIVTQHYALVRVGQGAALYRVITDYREAWVTCVGQLYSRTGVRYCSTARL